MSVPHRLLFTSCALIARPIILMALGVQALFVKDVLQELLRHGGVLTAAYVQLVTTPVILPETTPCLVRVGRVLQVILFLTSPREKRPLKCGRHIKVT